MALLKGTPTRHILAVLLGSLEIVLFGGVIFGWHSVVYIYKDVGYFSEDCGPVSPKFPDVQRNSSHLQKPPTNSTDISSPNITYASPVSDNSSSSNSFTTDFLKGNSTLEQNSIHFDELTCAEQMAVRGKAGGTSRVCDSQDEQFNLIFSLATGINGILSFPSGILYDRLGTRISRIVSIIFFVGGQLCLIFASQATPTLLYPGFMGLVYGGYQILLTNLQLGGLIPGLRSTIMSLYSGSYDTSSAVFLLFKAAHEGGVTINTMFAIQVSLYFCIFASSTFLLLPKTKIPNPLPPDFRLRSYLCNKFCGGGADRRSQAFMSQEWQVDANGSIILVQSPAKYADEVKTSNDRSASGSEGHLVDDERNGLAHVPQESSEIHASAQNGASKGVLEREDSNVVACDKEDSCTVDTVEKENSNHADERTKMVSLTEYKSSQKTDTPSLECEAMIRRKASVERKTFRQVACSPLFLTDLLWMCSQRLRSWIFVGMFNPWITRLACGDKKLVSHYTSVYAGLQFFGILTAPLSGRLMDRKIEGAEKYGNPRYERLHAAIASFVMNSTVSVVLTIGTLIPVLEVQYATFILHCLHRSFLYGPNSAFVANAFPSEHFGKLFGVTLTVSALFSCMQYPLFLIMQGPLQGDPFYINVFLLILMLISFIHPAYMWTYLKKKAAKRNM